MEKIRIQWKGPFLVQGVTDLDLGEGFGVYMLTRRWGKGEEKVLYIGMTYWQDFASRIDQHIKDWLNDEIGNIKIRLGVIELQRERRFSEQKTRDIESLLIYWSQPKYNIQNKQRYNGRDLKIINEGRRGPIDRIITTDYIEHFNLG